MGWANRVGEQHTIRNLEAAIDAIDEAIEETRTFRSDAQEAAFNAANEIKASDIALPVTDNERWAAELAVGRADQVINKLTAQRALLEDLRWYKPTD